MGSKRAPPAPDYRAAAEEQGRSSLQNTTAQTWANRPNVNTPWGSQIWNAQAGTDPATGQQITNWTQNIQLSPEQQQALDAQMRIQQGRSQGAETLLGQAVGNFQSPMDWNNLPRGADRMSAPEMGPGIDNTANRVQTGFDNTANRVQTEVGNPNAWRQTAQNAVWNLQRPMLDEQQAGAETQLTNMGVARGSEAWNREMRNLSDNRSRAGLMAIGAGRDEANQMFGQNLAQGQFRNQALGQQFGQNLQSGQFRNQALGQQFGQNLATGSFNSQAANQNFNQQMQAGSFNNQNRQQAIAEQMMRRGQSLNELNALLTGQQVGMPSMPSFTNAGRADTTNYMGAAQNQYGAAMNAFNARQQANQGLMSGLFGLGGAALTGGGWGGLFSMGG